jgi:hypothetical protein
MRVLKGRKGMNQTAIEKGIASVYNIEQVDRVLVFENEILA